METWQISDRRTGTGIPKNFNRSILYTSLQNPEIAMNSNPEIARKLYLNCPFSQKDEAKALGARWDQVRKRWYVPEQSDLTKFQRWLPQVATSVCIKHCLPRRGQVIHNYWMLNALNKSRRQSFFLALKKSPLPTAQK